MTVVCEKHATSKTLATAFSLASCELDLMLLCLQAFSQSGPPRCAECVTPSRNLFPRYIAFIVFFEQRVRYNEQAGSGVADHLSTS